MNILPISGRRAAQALVAAAIAAAALHGGVAEAIPLLSGFGGTADYGTNVLDVGDDNSSVAVSVAAAFPRGLNFFGMSFSSLFVNNNGNITFGGAVGTYTPAAFPISSQRMIAAWWGDVDTRAVSTTGNNRVYWDIRSGQVTITWHNVGYYSSHIDRFNDFQIVLLDRSATRVAGDFDVEFRYNRCDWTTGDASGGTGGLGGTPAQAGFDAGNGSNFSVLPGSRTSAVLALCTGTNAGTPGLWRIEVRSGNAAVCGNNVREMGEDCDGTDTPAGRMCSSMCRIGVPNGTACTAAMDCLSGNCVDGVCCNTACNGQCEACDLPVGRGACLPVTGAPRGTRTACVGTGTCGGTCNGTVRTACTFPDSLTSCGEASCSNGTITNPRTCDGAGACTAATSRMCMGYACVGTSCLTECASGADCASGFYCSMRQCLPATPNGGTCTTDVQCVSGHCVDGVCCNTACNGQCEACDVMGALGRCQAISGAPHGSRTACTGAAGEACTGTCNGTNPMACAYPDTTTACRMAGCTMGVAVTAATCDGMGACPAATPTMCGAYACSGAVCATACTTAADCATGNTCESGRCVAQRPNGAACTAGAQCTSGNCVDGVCCNTACNGQCEACDSTAMAGTCVPVMGAPHGTRMACNGMGTCAGVCDGTNAMACSYPGSSTTCRPAGCRGGMGVNPAGCDGMGGCPAESTATCGAYACGAMGCNTTCTTDAQCAMGNRCISGRCAPPVGAGTACRSAQDCVSGVCAQGVCCDRPCDGVCNACNTAGAVGMCTPRAMGARAGTSDDGGVSTCAMCNGRGGCAKTPSDAGTMNAFDSGMVGTTAGATSGCGCAVPGVGGANRWGAVALFGLAAVLRSRRRRS